ncbi:helix-turn-helix domain-containing protein [Cellulomonas sp. RIT-PI-Y]|uniref:AraC family transcriptional regulator n=1 Tax=Cellulomonas sp. RIT-PI-Y TaxID=3035297 RepID=UPI0021D7EB97|nr:helix-turn-helix domain-containing protein [Cellulomonas sp. RIT-PI-Y]
MTDDWRGILHPARLPTFHRLPAPAPVADLVRWFWVPEWDLESGQVSRQEVLPFPAGNLVVQDRHCALFGPTTRRSVRELRGRGWAVGALLRPAGLAALTDDPGALRDGERDGPAGLAAAVTSAWEGSAHPREAAVAAFADRLAATLDPPGDDALLANRMADLIDSDPTVLRVDDLAARLGRSERSVQRLAARHVGLPPLAMIRRRRLQEAAARLRTDPAVSLAELAAALGYSDQAHLTADFRTVLGLTPGRYRDDGRADPPTRGPDAPST